MDSISSISLVNAGLAACAGILGSVVTALLYEQSRNDLAGVANLRVIAAGLVFGTTSWIVYLVATGALSSIGPVQLPVTSVLGSIVTAVLFATMGFKVAQLTRRGPLIEIGGAVVGLSIVAVPLLLNWTGLFQPQQPHLTPTMAGVVLASVLFGAIATSRVARPVTCYCVYGGASGLMLGLLATHALLAGIVVL
ncbi:MAG: hypothetical protein AAGB04_09400 [Pseudomonadota bacterium]